MSGNPKLTPETEAKIKVLLYPKPQLTKEQELLLKQAQNCRDLAHFLRTDPRVEGHFNMLDFCSGEYSSGSIANDPTILHQCDTTACAAGWAIYLRMAPTRDMDEAFGVTSYGGGGPRSNAHVFGGISRTVQQEAQVLETHAAWLEAQV